jgi:hypothetical protein
VSLAAGRHDIWPFFGCRVLPFRRQSAGLPAPQGRLVYSVQSNKHEVFKTVALTDPGLGESADPTSAEVDQVIGGSDIKKLKCRQIEAIPSVPRVQGSLRRGPMIDKSLVS